MRSARSAFTLNVRATHIISIEACGIHAAGHQYARMQTVDTFHQ